MNELTLEIALEMLNLIAENYDKNINCKDCYIRCSEKDLYEGKS